MYALRLSAVLLSLSCLTLLVACSRENPLSDPAPYVEPEDVVCDIPTDHYVLYDNIRVQDGRGIGYDIYSPYVAQSTILDFSVLTDFIQFLPVQNGDLTDLMFTYLQIQMSNSSDPVTIQLSQDEVDLIDNGPTGSTLFTISSGSDNYLIEYTKTSSEVVIDGELQTIINESITAYLAGEPAALTSRLNVEINGLDISIKDVDLSLPVDAISPPLSIQSGLNNIELNIDGSLLIPRQLLSTEMQEDCSLSDADEFIEVDFNHIYDFTLYREIQAEVSNVKIDYDNLVESGRFGSSISRSESHLAIGMLGDDSSHRGSYEYTNIPVYNTNAPDSGAVILYDLNSSSISTYIKASNAEAGDQFGYAVSVWGDYLAVSAPGEDSISTRVNGPEDNNLALNSGAVYIFKREVEEVAGVEVVTWNQQAYIKPPINTPADNGYDNGFGQTLLLRDGFLLIGAPNEDSGGEELVPNSGAVFIYKLSETDGVDVWQYTQALKAPNSGEDDLFGSSLSLSDSGQLLIGAPAEDSSFNGISVNSDLGLDDLRIDSGAAYLYRNQNGSFVFDLYLKPSVADTGDAFGSSVYVDGHQFFIGAPLEDSNGKGLNRNITDNSLLNSGAVFGFTYDDEMSEWRESVYIKASESQANAQFGKRIVGDINNLLIASPFYQNTDINTNGEYFQGRVYTFKYDETGVEFGFELPGLDVGVNAATNDGLLDDQLNARFGHSMAIYGNGFAIGSEQYDEIDEGTALPILKAGRVDIFD